MSASEGSSSLPRVHDGASTVRSVVTQPPWARHEPPSPELDSVPFSDLALHPLHSAQSSSAPRASTSSLHSSSTSGPAADARRWRLPSVLNQLRRDKLARTSEEEQPDQPAETAGSYFPEPPARQSSQGLRLQIPRNAHSFTLAQSKTPGWATPWAPGRPSRAYLRSGAALAPDGLGTFNELSEHEKHDAELSAWKRRRRTVRNFVLTNGYVPLMIRLLNVVFTVATLCVAVRIRHVEIKQNVLGAVGSSPILAIIFSPLTLAHVLMAIYLEYFGRPLGLWRTSRKLAHTLFEVLFICIWSGSFSVAVDNYFSSPLLCTPARLNIWWNHLPPLQASPLTLDPRVAHGICRDQLAIVCLELVGLGLYCASLVVSLFRIFEKVKIHTTLSRSYA